jgi:hypothetical protein
MEPWPADSTKRSRSGQSGRAASKRRKRENSTVATSAMPMGMPGCPDLAFCTASMAKARIALVMPGWPTAGVPPGFETVVRASFME